MARLGYERGAKTSLNTRRSTGIHVPVTKRKPYSSDGNLFHLSFEGGVLGRPLDAGT